jgi:hypothetical protein
MWLKIKVLKELDTEVGEWKAEAAFEMGEKDHKFSGFEIRLHVPTRWPTSGTLGDAMALHEPEHIMDVGV